MVRQTVAHLYNGILFSNEKDKLSIYATTWMNLRIIMGMKEVRQKKKNNPENHNQSMAPFI